MSLIGFIGAGWVESDTSGVENNDDIIAGGVGFRYLIARQLGIHTGLDLAQGPEEAVLYLQMGVTW